MMKFRFVIGISNKLAQKPNWDKKCLGAFILHEIDCTYSRNPDLDYNDQVCTFKPHRSSVMKLANIREGEDTFLLALHVSNKLPLLKV